jgi:circadian clock protein KaiC
LSDRIQSGIPGLDRLVDGGLSKGNVIILAGRAGTGKSIFGAQFAFYGSLMSGERTVYISFTEDRTKFIRHMKRFGLEIEEMETKGLMKFVSIPIPQIGQQGKILEEIASIFDEFKPSRAVLDPFSALTIPITGNKSEQQVFMQALVNKIASYLDCTTLLIAEVSANADQIGSGIEEYMVDGIIVLYYLIRGKAKIKAIEIRKMRGTHHSNQAVLLEITDNGIVVDPDIELT